MSKLLTKQFEFAEDVGKLLTWLYDSGYTVTFGEALRTPEQAAIYAKKGIGISNSLHTIKLAIDLNLFKEGRWLTRTMEYRAAGEYWESLRDGNSWGGWFNDGNHFSREHEGVR